ncbi:unnamed protein product, partial [Owenia fusiformis]
MEATYAQGRGNADKCQIKADVEETVVVATTPRRSIRFRVLPCRTSAEPMSFLPRPFGERCLCKNRGECVRDEIGVRVDCKCQRGFTGARCELPTSQY